MINQRQQLDKKLEAAPRCSCAAAAAPSVPPHPPVRGAWQDRIVSAHGRKASRQPEEGRKQGGGLGGEGRGPATEPPPVGALARGLATGAGRACRGRR